MALGLILFYTFISDLEEEVKCTGSLVRPGQVESRMKRNFMRFNKGERRVLHLGRNKCIYQYRLVTEMLEVAAEKELGFLVGRGWPVVDQQLTNG